MKIKKNDAQALRASARGNWRDAIVAALKANNGLELTDIFTKTHPTRTGRDGRPMSEQQQANSFASVRTHLADDGYIISRDEGKFYLLTEPSEKKDELNVIPGQEERVKRILG